MASENQFEDVFLESMNNTNKWVRNHQRHMSSGLPLLRIMKRSLSMNDSNSPRSVNKQQPQACVCAPPTHSGSFKCRFHRVNSLGAARNQQQQQLYSPLSNDDQHRPNHLTSSSTTTVAPISSTVCMKQQQGSMMMNKTAANSVEAQ